jgi:hypothetical protein
MMNPYFDNNRTHAFHDRQEAFPLTPTEQLPDFRHTFSRSALQEMGARCAARLATLIDRNTKTLDRNCQWTCNVATIAPSPPTKMSQAWTNALQNRGCPDATLTLFTRVSEAPWRWALKN